MRQELIAHLNCLLNAEEECGDSRDWHEYFPVATRDVLSYALCFSVSTILSS